LKRIFSTEKKRKLIEVFSRNFPEVFPFSIIG
jgi:hypothetical protein